MPEGGRSVKPELFMMYTCMRSEVGYNLACNKILGLRSSKTIWDYILEFRVPDLLPGEGSGQRIYRSQIAIFYDILICDLYNWRIFLGFRNIRINRGVS